MQKEADFFQFSLQHFEVKYLSIGSTALISGQVQMHGMMGVCFGFTLQWLSPALKEKNVGIDAVKL